MNGCVQLPNVLGFVLGLLQMLLYAIYRNRNEKDIKKDQKKALPLEPLKSVVIENPALGGGGGEVSQVEKNEQGGKKLSEDDKDEEKEKSEEPNNVCGV